MSSNDHDRKSKAPQNREMAQYVKPFNSYKGRCDEHLQHPVLELSTVLFLIELAIAFKASAFITVIGMWHILKVLRGSGASSHFAARTVRRAIRSDPIPRTAPPFERHGKGWQMRLRLLYVIDPSALR